MSTRSENESGSAVPRSAVPRGPLGLLKRQRLLIATGFVIVAVGNGAEFWVVSYGAPGSYGWSNEIFGAAYTLGYGLLAWATWSWFEWIEGLPTPVTGLVKAIKLFGIANLVFAIGLVSVTYYWAHRVISLPYEGKVSIAIPTTNGLQLLGFCLVSVGFWSAASRLRAGVVTGSTTPEQVDFQTPV